MTAARSPSPRAWALAGLLAAASALLPTGAEAEDSVSAELIRAAPKELIVQAGDLGVDFAIQGGDDQPDGQYVAMYFRPEVLESSNLPEGDLLGVLASVQVLDSIEAARQAFGEAADGASILDSIQRGPAGAARDVRAVDVEIPGSDDALSFRVEYELGGVAIVEYRHRIRVANSVSNLLVSGRAGRGGLEPPRLAVQARTAVERQAARLAAAKGRPKELAPR